MAAIRLIVFGIREAVAVRQWTELGCRCRLVSSIEPPSRALARNWRVEPIELRTDQPIMPADIRDTMLV
jgi:hypothetical protein